ncbi:TMEM175 family protein [Microbacterium aurantiacum]|uniref:TMEM175 family protein n=1 Tax=Microbacterium aurantiacum TaxID=162393 RepID=UPI001FE7ED1C|nr:TMEM175 family protein [Microbacterium aurantiacum]
MTDERTPHPLKAERFKAFVDAVVAIAMTLLILPLLESVSEAASEGLGTAEFLGEHSGQLLSFGLSFVLIAAFWMEHHRMYSRVEGMTGPLLWINAGWLLTIVWLPVPTAMLGQMEGDAVQAVLYIGTLILTQVTTLAAKLYLLRHPELHDFPAEEMRHGALGDVAAIILFAIALPIAAWVHPIGYYALLLIALTGPVTRILTRLPR